MLFSCKGLLRWRIAGCNMTYGVPNATPITLLDNQSTGVGDTLNAASVGIFANNTVSNVGGLSTQDLMRVNGTYIQIVNNNFSAQADGSLTASLVIHSLINGSYTGAGTVKCIFSDNTMRYFNMSRVSLFGTKRNNIDTVGHSTLVGTAYPGALAINPGAATTFNVTVTGAALGDIVTGVSFILNQLAGLSVTANVTAADTVTVQLAKLDNAGAGTINVSNELWTVMVQRRNCL